MKIPMPFPYCPKCKKKSLESYHHKPGCNGLMYIDPDTEMVSCSKCSDEWLIWKSTYHCSCGHIFKASEVKEEVNSLIQDCKYAAAMILLDQKAYWKRKQMTQESKTKFFTGLFEGLGYTIGKNIGYITHYILEFFSRMFGI